MCVVRSPKKATCYGAREAQRLSALLNCVVRKISCRLPVHDFQKLELPPAEEKLGINGSLLFAAESDSATFQTSTIRRGMSFFQVAK